MDLKSNKYIFQYTDEIVSYTDKLLHPHTMILPPLMWTWMDWKSNYNWNSKSNSFFTTLFQVSTVKCHKMGPKQKEFSNCDDIE